MNKKLIKNIFILSFLFLLVFSFVGCKNKEEENKDYVNLTCDVTSVGLGDEIQVVASSNKFGTFAYESSDVTIAKVDEDGFVKGISKGKVIITAYLLAYPDLKGSIEITVTDPSISNVKVTGPNAGKIGDVLTVYYTVSPKGIDVLGEFVNNNPELVSIAKIASNKVEITLLHEGIANIEIKFNDSSNYTESFNIGIFSYNDLVVDSNKTANIGDIIEYNGNTYYYGFTYLNNLKDALNNISENGKITVLKGSYEKDSVLKVNNVTINGVASGNGELEDCPVIKNSIVIDKNVTGTVINNLVFTGNGNIYMSGNNDNSTIALNLFIKCNANQAWRKQCSDACIYLDSDTNSFDSVTISKNIFKDISNYGVAFNYANGIKITDNQFENFELDAIHANGTEVLDSAQWLIRGNTFKNGAYNAIYFYGYGPKVVSYDNVISIFDNKFENIGNNHTDNEFYGAISLDNYNGGTCAITIRYNEFIDCLGNVRIDSACDERYVKNVSANINYNKFVSDSVNYYFDNKTDSLTTEKNVITNLDYNLFTKKDNSLVDAKKYSNGYLSLANNISLSDYSKLNKVYGTNTLYKESSSKFIIEGKDVTWKSSNTNVVTIDKDGLAKAIEEGTAIISAMQGTTVLATYDVIVKPEININYATLLVQIALKEEGYREGSNNYTKYGVWYGSKHGKEYENGAWCAMFVSWCANQANIPTTIIPEYALVSAGRQWFESRGLFRYKEDYTPKTGDLIFFLSNGASHTGIVVNYRDGVVYTIEGNTSDMCAQRNYNPMKATITGYGLPEYPIYTGGKTVEFDISSSTDGSDHKTT